MSGPFELQVEGGIGRLTLGNAALKNALGRSFFSEFGKALRRLDESGACRVLVINSSGPHFCSGIDLSFLGDPTLINTGSALNREKLRRLILALQEPISALAAVRFPVIAACQGASIGAAVDLLSACDLRFATNDAYFVIEEINIGLMADLGSLQRLPGALPDAIVREMAFTGLPLDSQRALSLGFVNGVLADYAALMKRVDEMAQLIASRAPLAVAASKQALNYNRSHSTADSLDYAATLQAAIIDPASVAASVMARKLKQGSASFENLSSDFSL
jgi:enoyl-CoA hydratase